MKQIYRLIGATAMFALFCSTSLKAANGGGKTLTNNASLALAANSSTQELFIIAPPDLHVGVDWEECSVLIPHEDLGTPSIPENCKNCTVTRSNEDEYYEYYQYYYPGTTTITWTVTDEFGKQASDTQDIVVTDDQPPIFPYFQPDIYEAVAEPGACGAHVNFATPSAGDNCSSTTVRLVTGDYASGDFFNIGTTELTYEAEDESGNTDYFTIYIVVEDLEVPEFTTTPEPIIRPADAGTAGATFTLPTPEATDNCGEPEVSSDAPVTFPVGTTTVTWTARDASGNTNSVSQLVTITENSICVAPVIAGLQVPQQAQPVRSSVAVSAVVTGDEISSATWYWGDGSHSEGSLGGNTITGVHRYTSAGMYTLSLEVENSCGETAVFSYEHLVIYNPAAGFVTGGGWFYSPAGAWLSRPSVKGKAHFSLNSKYLPKGNEPKGSFNLKLQAGGLNFKGTSQQWLLVDDYQAMYKGMGDLNGMSGYSYLVSVVDSGMTGKNAGDKVRVILWDPSGDVVYDNQPGAALDAAATQTLGGGSVAIHGAKQKGKKNAKETAKSAAIASSSGATVLSAYPNPLSAEGLWLAFPELNSDQEVKAAIYDLNGRVMAEKTFVVRKEGGSYQWQLVHSNWASGMYLLLIQTEERTEQIKILK